MGQIFEGHVHPLKVVKIKNPFGILQTNTPIPQYWVGFFIGPRSPGPIYVSGLCHWVSTTPFWNLTDVTLADKETNLILTDKVNRVIQGNVAMQVTQPGGQPSNFGSDVTWWPNFDPICNKSEDAYLNEIQIRF